MHTVTDALIDDLCDITPILWTREILEDVILLYSQGASIRAIGKKYGLSPKPVNKALQHFGIEIRGQGGGKFKFTPEEEALIVKALKRGLAQTEAAKWFGTTRETICKIAQRARLEKTREQHPKSARSPLRSGQVLGFDSGRRYAGAASLGCPRND